MKVGTHLAGLVLWVLCLGYSGPLHGMTNSGPEDISYLAEYSKILELTNTYYENAWGKLLVLITIFGSILSVIGGLLIVAIPFYQRQSLKDERERMEQNLKDEKKEMLEGLKELKEELLEEIKAKSDLSKEEANRQKDALISQIGTLKDEAEKRIKESEVKSELQINEALGGVYHLQGNIQFEEKLYKQALESYLSAANRYADSKTSSRNVEKVLDSLSLCLDELQHKDLFDTHSDEKFSRVLKKIEFFRPELQYLLPSIKEKYEAAKVREPVK
jgi:hypothetical protein